MPPYVFYTMVQKSQKWPKTQIKGGGVLPKIPDWSFSQNQKCGPQIFLNVKKNEKQRAATEWPKSKRATTDAWRK